MKSHYDTLNIPATATKEEIKKSFHKLSLKYHPDLTKSKSTTNNELFKQISSAYTVLNNDKQRQMYDLELNDWNKFGQHRRQPGGGGGFGGGGFGQSQNSNTDIFGNRRTGSGGFHSFAEGIFKPRNVVIGVTLGLIAVSTFKSVLGIEKDVQHAEKSNIIGDGKKKLVEAWKNPKTGQWEQPAPWSKTFQQLKPEIHLVPRKDVRPSRP